MDEAGFQSWGHPMWWNRENGLDKKFWNQKWKMDFGKTGHTQSNCAAMAILAMSALPALADRQVTADERATLAAAVQAEGCSGGKFEMDEDDQQFEVDHAVCADGKKYDLKFDMQMRLKRKNLD